MSTAETRSTFVRRFDRIWAQARRVQLSQALCWAVLTALAGVSLLAAADYWLELTRPWRLGAVVAIGVASISVAILLAARSVRRWQRGATAAAIEHVFPQLGQRIRTTVQYGELSTGQIEESGVATTLVDALESDTVKLAQPLPLDAVVPWKSLALASMLAAVVGLLLAGASALNWEWRAAATRAFLGDEPYTTIKVEPGDVSVREGESVVIEVEIEGRIGKQATFWSRRADEPDGEWREDRLEPLPEGDAQGQLSRFEMPLDPHRLRQPLEYKVSAGTVTSSTFHVNVLYPLKIARIQAIVASPEYTGLAETTLEGGHITALVGSQVKLRIELDRPATTAWVELQSVPKSRREEPVVERLPLVLDGANLEAQLEISADKTYAVFAKSADGMELPENKYRIRARQDEPPLVWFENPPEALEVHTLAEILMRIRLTDDFGLSRAGIMFEVNNEEEYPLLAEDFLAAAEELKAEGRLSPKTRATLEKMLPLEHFALSQQDSVMYYAFAEDIRPGSAQRTETDLRFIDIRPFRRNYRVLAGDDMPMAGNQGPQLKSLEELVARQRHALNRAIGISRKIERGAAPDLSAIDSLIKFEGEFAQATRELALGLERLGINETELLYEAENSMLAATDSLSAGKYETATLQMRDALKHLIEGRIRIQVNLNKNRDRQQLAQLRQFDRTQQQKLRRPKSDEEEAREIAQKLEDLANREDFVYETIASILDPSGNSKDKNSTASGNTGEPKKPAEDADKGDKPEDRGDKPEDKGDKPGDKGDKPEDKGDKPGDKGDEPKEGDKPDGGKGPGDTPRSKQDLEDRQLDVAVDAREVEKALAKLPKATDLAKERMAAAAKAADEAAAELGKGPSDEAKKAAGEAKAAFRELADQVRALLAEEQADRIAAAQQMAQNLARKQEDFADKLADKDPKASGQGETDKPKKQEGKTPGTGKGNDPQDDAKMEDLKGRAQQIAEKAKTIADVLGAAGKAENPEDQESAKKIEELVGSLDLKALAERLGNLPEQVERGKLEDAKAAAGDGAERLEAAAQQLAALHRQIVAPRVDELAKLDEKVAGLDERLDKLETDSRVTGWHNDAEDLLEELEQAGISKEQRMQFEKEMKDGGWGPEVRRRGWQWGRTEAGYYQAPDGYRASLAKLSVSLRDRMQELLLGDLRASGDEPIPPQYQDLVDRYQRVLTTEGKTMTKPRGQK